MRSKDFERICISEFLFDFDIEFFGLQTILQEMVSGMEEDFFKKSTAGQLVDVVDMSTVLGASISLSLQKCEINKASMIPQIFQELILILILYTDVVLKCSASMALLDTFRSSRFACFSRGSRTLRLRRCVDFRRTGWSADD